MINTALAAPLAAPRRRKITAPSGATYNWDEPGEPTEADWNALKTYDAQHGARIAAEQRAKQSPLGDPKFLEAIGINPKKPVQPKPKAQPNLEQAIKTSIQQSKDLNARNLGENIRNIEKLGIGDPRMTGMENIPVPRGDEPKIGSKGAFSGSTRTRFSETPEGKRGDEAMKVVASIIGIPADNSPAEIGLSLLGIIPGAALAKGLSKIPGVTKAVNALKGGTDAIRALDLLDSAGKAAMEGLSREAADVLEKGGVEGLQKWAKERGHTFVDKSKPMGVPGTVKPVKKPPTPKADAVGKGGTKEPWEMTRNEFRGRRKLPPMERLPDSGNYPYIKTDDGSIYWGDDKSHVLMAERLGIPPERIESGGFIDNGSISDSGSSSANIAKLVRQEQAKLSIAREDAIETALKEGKPVPAEVLADYPDLAAKYGKTNIESGGGAVPTGGGGRGLPKPEVPSKVESAIPPVKEPVAKAEVGAGKDTGLANQVQERESLAGIIDEVETASGKGMEHWQKVGKDAVDNGEDFEFLADEVASGKAELTGERVGALLEGKRQLLNDVNRKVATLAKDPTNKLAKQELDAARERLQAYVQKVQAGKGRWSDVGRALQAGTTLNEGDFAQVIQEAESTGRKLNPKTEKELQTLTTQVADRDVKIADLEAKLKEAQADSGVQSIRTQKRAVKREAIIAEIDDLAKQWLESTSRLSANPIEPAAVLGKIAYNYVKLGALTLDEAIEKTIVKMAELGHKVDRQQVIDSMATPEHTRTRSEIEKQVSELRGEAKRLSKVGEPKKLADVNARIESLKTQLDTGDFIAKPKKPSAVSQELERLRDERDVYANKVRSTIKAHTDAGKGIARDVIGGIRSFELGSDIGVLTRQGLFAWSRPITAIKSAGKAALSTFSPEMAARFERTIRDRRVNGVLAQIERNKAGLDLTNTVSRPEEISIARLIKRIPIIGEYIGGSLERFQSVFINSVRADTFDRALELGYTPKELQQRAAFINNATGRGNIKNLPEQLELILTSPRYEISRWSMIGEAVRNPGRLIGGVVTGKGVNRAAAANIQDMAVTAAEVYGLFKLAELGGYEVDFNPTSTDFLKMRKGDEVWDVSAGLAPRIRDMVRMGALIVEPEYRNNAQDWLAKAATRPISPGIRTPAEQASIAIQQLRGKTIGGKGDKKVVNPISGFPVDEDDSVGMLAFAPLIYQVWWKTLNQEGILPATWAAAREGVGGSVNRYPKSKNPKKN